MNKSLFIALALLCAGSANAQTLKEGEMPILPPFPEIPEKKPIGSVKLADINTFAEVKLDIPITDGPFKPTRASSGDISTTANGMPLNGLCA